MSKIIPLDEIQGTMPRIGKLSAGYMESKTVNNRVVTYPAKSRTLVFRCSSPEILRAAAKIVGGTVSKSPNPRSEGSVWRLVSEATDLEVLIASDDRQDAPARYEAWGASGKIRECDGHTCRFMIDPKTGERRENVPCWCAAQELQAEDADACRITTRLNLFVPAFMNIPGIGVWQLESRGRTTYQDLKGLRDLFQRMHLPGAMGAPVTLRIEIVRRRNPGNGDPQEFPVFRFQSRLSLTDTLARAREFAATVKPAQLPPPDDSTPPLGAVMDPEQEALSAATPVVDARTVLPGPSAEQTTPTPAASKDASGPLPDTQAPKIDSAGDLGKLITEAARAEGYDKGRDWLKAHFQIAVSTPSQIPPEKLAEVRALAEDVLNRRARPADDLRDLITRAAQAQGYEGPDPVGHWLSLHYLTSDLDDLKDEEWEDARVRATSMLQAAESSPAPGESADSAPATKPAGSSTPPPAVGADDATDEPEKLSPDDAQELRIMIERAAKAEGFEGKDASRKWVVARYGLKNGKLEDVPRALRARIRTDALRILSQPAHPKNSSPAPAPAPQSPTASPATGNGDVVPTNSAPTASPANGQSASAPATADQLEAIRRQCTIRGIVVPERDTGIRQSARRDLERLEDLTQAQAERVLRYLNYVAPIRSQQAVPPA